MSSYFIVFLGAGLGGAMRHGVNVAALRVLGTGFPYGTFTANVVGSLVMGLIAGWFVLKGDAGQAWRLFLTTGILGGFTTFSTFSLDTALMWQRGEVATCTVYVVASVLVALLGLFAGLFIVRQFA